MEAEDRKNSILRIAGELFVRQGFDKTSISDILKEAGIARGTLYYHFDSKEEIMNELIRRYGEAMVDRAREVAEDQTLPVRERLVATIFALNAQSAGDGEGQMMVEHMHRPENALMHQKMNSLIFRDIPPILAGIVEEGAREGLFHCEYPETACEMILIYSGEVFGETQHTVSAEEQLNRVKGFLYHLDRLFGAEPGFFLPLLDLLKNEN